MTTALQKRSCCYLEAFDASFFTLLTSKLSIACFKAGAIVGVNLVCAESNDGLGNALGFVGSGVFWAGSSSMILGAGFSGTAFLTFECFDISQPLMFKNSVKSTLFLLQHVQPL